MALLPETRAALARYDAWLGEALGSPQRLAQLGHRLRAMVRDIGRRLRNMALGVFTVAVLAFLYGSFIAPLGFLGVVVMVLGMLVAAMLLAALPPTRTAPARLASGPLAQLPARSAGWLTTAALDLPADVAADARSLAQSIRALAPVAARVAPDSPEADDLQRLLASHLPRLIDSYAQVPPPARNSAAAQAHLREGLAAVATEVTRLSGSMASARLQDLETEGRFLQSRYQPPDC